MRKSKVNYSSIIAQCILCQSYTSSPSGFCPACLDDLPWLPTHCHRCSIPLPSNSNNLICAECQKKTPSFDKVTALFEYEFPIDNLISQIKYGKKPQLLGHLAQLAIGKLELSPDIECLIPIPMHRHSLLQRGFNQAELLAMELSKQLNIPVERRFLRKIKKTERQMQLTRSARLQNQKNVFECHFSNHKHILLVDDVMTTGATLEAASRCLKMAGTQTIEAFVLARTER
ncbi:MAG: ComF family protein [Neptuniibacter sp.]